MEARVLTAVMLVSGNSEMTPEEQKAADEKKAMIEKAKARGREKAKLTKSMIILDVKPWDDTTGRAPGNPEIVTFHAVFNRPDDLVCIGGSLHFDT